MQVQPLEAHLFNFPQEPPPPFMLPDGLHAYTCEQAVKAFESCHGTGDMVPNLVMAVRDADRQLACWPLPWSGPEHKIRMLDCLRAVFAQPESRPDRYTFQGEVWMANVSAEEYETYTGSVSERPDRVDGLVVITVDPKAKLRVQLSAYVRGEDGTVTPWDTTADVDTFSGRLSTLLDPPSDNFAFEIYHGETRSHGKDSTH